MLSTACVDFLRAVSSPQPHSKEAASRLYLPYIPPTSPHISGISPQHLPHISPTSRQASFEWPEAIELMQTRNAVEAMMQFMKNEELYGAVDMPVWVERTAVGSSVQALLQCLPQLRIEGTIVGRLMTRMAEVLEGRHTDEEIADTDVQQLRDFTLEGEEQRKRRIAQHSLFVQVDGPGELLRYLMLHIKISPTVTL